MGEIAHIREAMPEDAAAVVALFQLLYSETDFLLYEPGESVPQVDQYAERIREVAKKENGIMFVAESGRDVVGIIFGNRGIAKKTRHSLFLVMGVRRSNWSQGVGRGLLEAVENWATTRQLHRLELTVQTSNTRAIALYEKMGFGREGIKRHSLKNNGRYVDEFLMSKLIAA
jgi:RimJ/RimL family protein N-acetyltransferase